MKSKNILGIIKCIAKKNLSKNVFDKVNYLNTNHNIVEKLMNIMNLNRLFCKHTL